MNSAYPKIITLASDRNYDGIIQVQNSLYIEKMKLDKFFSLFLDKFDRKMDPENTDTPIWKLYKAKLKEYADVQQSITTAKYYLTRSNV